MYRITKRFTLPIGHKLMKNKGLCKNFHGHNIDFEVKLSSKTLNENDMVMDFVDLKNLMSEFITEFDHVCMLNGKDESIAKFFKEQGMKIYIVNDTEDIDPTAEVLANIIFVYLSKRIPEGISLDLVSVWENDKSVAEYSEY